MPELPEVETVRRGVEERLRGKEIIGVEVRHESIFDAIDAEGIKSMLLGNSVERMERRGKYLIFCMSHGERILLHLRMTGQLCAFDDVFMDDKHCHLVVHFAKGGFYYRDVRRFGRFCPMGLGGKTEAGFECLGYEPMDRQFTLNYVKEGLRGRHCPVKARILDQRFIAGIGNIYADEILFRARIHPLRPCDELTNCQIKRLKKACETVLEEAIADHGTTFRDFRDVYGESGSHQEYLAVYHRAGEPCLVCGEMIAETKCAGRTTSFCPKCQKR